MGISDVCSPVTRKGSKVGSVAGKPLSPGARSSPGRANDDSVPKQPEHGAKASHQEPPSAQPQPERRDRVARHQEEPPIPVGAIPIVTGPEE
jgi:hypothetical protein